MTLPRPAGGGQHGAQEGGLSTASTWPGIRRSLEACTAGRGNLTAGDRSGRSEPTRPHRSSEHTKANCDAGARLTRVCLVRSAESRVVQISMLVALPFLLAHFFGPSLLQEMQ